MLFVDVSGQIRDKINVKLDIFKIVIKRDIKLSRSKKKYMDLWNIVLARRFPGEEQQNLLQRSSFPVYMFQIP